MAKGTFGFSHGGHQAWRGLRRYLQDIRATNLTSMLIFSTNTLDRDAFDTAKAVRVRHHTPTS